MTDVASCADLAAGHRRRCLVAKLRARSAAPEASPLNRDAASRQGRETRCATSSSWRPFCLEPRCASCAPSRRCPACASGSSRRSPSSSCRPTSARARRRPLAGGRRASTPSSSRGGAQGWSQAAGRARPAARRRSSSCRCRSASVRERARHPGHVGGEAAQNFRDKARMKNVLRAAGVPCARHRARRGRGRRRGRFARAGRLPAGGQAAGGRRRQGHLPRRRRRSSCARRWPSDPPRPRPAACCSRSSSSATSTRSTPSRSAAARSGTRSPTTCRRRSRCCASPWIQWCVLLPREVDAAALRRHPRASPSPALDALGMDTGLSHMEWFRRPDGSRRDLRGRRAAAGRADQHAHLLRPRLRLLRGLGAADGLRRPSTPPSAQVRRRRRLPARPGRGARARRSTASSRRSASWATSSSRRSCRRRARRRRRATRARATSSSATPRPRWSSEALQAISIIASARGVEVGVSRMRRPDVLAGLPGGDAVLHPRPRRGRRARARDRRPARGGARPTWRATRSPATSRCATCGTSGGCSTTSRRWRGAARLRPRRVPVGAGHDPRRAAARGARRRRHDRRARRCPSATRSAMKQVLDAAGMRTPRHFRAKTGRRRARGGGARSATR